MTDSQVGRHLCPRQLLISGSRPKVLLGISFVGPPPTCFSFLREMCLVDRRACRRRQARDEDLPMPNFSRFEEVSRCPKGAIR